MLGIVSGGGMVEWCLGNGVVEVVGACGGGENGSGIGLCVKMVEW